MFLHASVRRCCSRFHIHAFTLLGVHGAQLATNTYAAYNNYGGTCFYGGFGRGGQQQPPARLPLC